MPKEIQKKVLLLKHFAEYLEGAKANEEQNRNFKNDNEKGEINNIENKPNLKANTESFINRQEATTMLAATGAGIDSTVLVKKWLRTKHAILIRLNNKVVQVCF